MLTAPHSATSFPLAARRARILVVDDQPMNIRLLHQILSREHSVFMATGGEQALALCRKSPPDLVLLDVVMPGMGGLEVCRRLKGHPDTEAIPVIFVTGSSQSEEENACWEAGAVDFVNKPVNHLTLRHRVHAHLQLKFQADALRAMAFADGLTGIANRRLFDETLEAEWRRCSRGGATLALLMLDVDYFKRYNDRYGHQAGDDCLKRIAATLRAALMRPSDLVARYGGEEFVCLLAETDAAGAMATAERLEAAVRGLAIEHIDSTVAAVVTISSGAAVAQPHLDGGADGAALVRRADAALYRAKQMGRGRACLAQAGDAALQSVPD
ncbi:diguanylate cyclase [Janthinobacterium sp.]|uniref:diguanylate cyclase n=1 Tax=Janthinobacterium sp. TaxID=1871054 RepID=UPI00293D782D|nr:diguanylate cyclase [Janthinobacterium sp.]